MEYGMAGLLRCCSPRTCQESPSMVLGKAAHSEVSLWPLYYKTARPWCQGKLAVLGVAGALEPRSCACFGNLFNKHPGTRKQNSFLCSVSLAPSTDKALTPVRKGKMFKGSGSTFTEQSKRVNLELKSDKIITGRFCNYLNVQDTEKWFYFICMWLI